MSAGMTDRERINSAASVLRHYMDGRAAYEGFSHTLSRGFYSDALQKGCRLFFGITVDPDAPHPIIDDEQNPEWFRVYMGAYRRVADARVH